MKYTPEPFKVIHWQLEKTARSNLNAKLITELFPKYEDFASDIKYEHHFLIRWVFRLATSKKVPIFSMITEQYYLIMYDSSPNNIEVLQNLFSASYSNFNKEYTERKSGTLLQTIDLPVYEMSESAIIKIINIFIAQAI